MTICDPSCAPAKCSKPSAKLDNGPSVLDANLQQYSGPLKCSHGYRNQRFAIQEGGYDGR
jgi:hypothetical protein